MKIILNESQLKKILTEISSSEIDIRANEANIYPTDAQKEASNYKMGHISVRGMKISIENPKGSYRKYKNEDGTAGYNLMKNHYGYFNITKGRDGDAVDVFIGPNIDDFENVYCVDQNTKDGNFDETKVMLGFISTDEAKKAYLSNYSPDWKGFRRITCVPLKTFKKWLYRGRKQRLPFGEYVLIQKKKLEESKARKNDEGKTVPEKCACGGKINLEIHGEPVYICNKCRKYFGTMPFSKKLNEEIINLEQKKKFDDEVEVAMNLIKRWGDMRKGTSC